MSVAIAALMGGPLVLRGAVAVATGHFAFTPKLGPVTHMVGASAQWMGTGFMALGCMVMAVAGCQWDTLRPAALVLAGFAFLLAALAFGLTLGGSAAS